jgi:hypothetical protein
MVRRTNQNASSATDGADRDDRFAAFTDFEILTEDGMFVETVANASTSVKHATGMVAVQLDGSIGDAAAALEAHAIDEGRSLESVAEEVVDRRLVFPINQVQTKRKTQARHVEDWYAENHARTDASVDEEPVDADRWLYVHRSEVVGASSAAAVALITEAGMVPHIDHDQEEASAPPTWDTGRISLLIGDDGRVQSADWG